MEKFLIKGTIIQENGHLVCTIPPASPKHVRSKWGLVRSLLANMVHGVHQGFNRTLEVRGIGYKAKQEGSNVVFNVGYSHPVNFVPPEGITLKVEGVNKVIVSGIDKQVVGQVSADIRSIRAPEHYKGTGIRYDGENVRIKEGKKLAA